MSTSQTINTTIHNFDNHLASVRAYPYASSYLWILIGRSRNGVDYRKIHAITLEIQDWLSEYVRRDGKNNYEWSLQHLTSTIRNTDGTFMTFANILRFRYAEDMLAFQLKFNLHEH